MKDDQGRAITYDCVTHGTLTPFRQMEPAPGGKYVDAEEYRELERKVTVMQEVLGGIMRKLETYKSLFCPREN